MMKKQVVLLLLFFLFSRASAVKLNYSLEGFGEKASGYTEYHIQMPTTVLITDGYTIDTSISTGHSVLAFPIDGYRAGIKGCLLTQPKGNKNIRYGLELEISKTFIQPAEAMVDSDWVVVPELTYYQDRFIFGATESEAKLSDYDVSLAGVIKRDLSRNIVGTVSGGYQFKRYQYDIYGISGWYDRDLDGVHEVVPPYYYQGVNVLDYKVTYSIFSLGTNIELLSNEGLRLSIGGIWFPYVSAKDLDDHLLRYKTAESDCQGSGYSLKAKGSAKLNPSPLNNGSNVYLGIGYCITRITATGSQIQKWYGDDPASDDFDDTGSVTSPIENTLKLRQNIFSAFIEYKF